MKNKEYKHITHESLKQFIDEESSILILGTLPSVKSREYNFYYSHPRNRFYKVISLIFKEELPITIEDKKSLLIKHHVALYDVIEECDIIGSGDSSIKNVVPTDIKGLLSIYPKIKKIILTGKTAKRLFDKYILKDIEGMVEVYYCSSTSPANAKTSLDDLLNEYSKVL